MEMKTKSAIDYYDAVMRYSSSLNTSANENWEWGILGGCERPLTRTGALELADWWETAAPTATEIATEECRRVAAGIRECVTVVDGRARMAAGGKKGAETLGPKGRAARAKAGAAARWLRAPYTSYAAARKAYAEPKPATDAMTGATVWLTADHIKGAELVGVTPAIVCTPKLGGVPHPEFARRFKLVKAPVGYVLRCSEDARVSPESCTLFCDDIADLSIWWYGSDLRAARLKLRETAHRYRADNERWSVSEE